MGTLRTNTTCYTAQVYPLPADLLAPESQDFQEDDPGFTYQGTWSLRFYSVHEQGRMKACPDPAASFSRQVTGRRFQLVSSCGQGGADFKVEVNGQLLGTGTQYAGAGDTTPVVTYTSPDLGEGLKHVVVTKTSSDRELRSDMFRESSEAEIQAVRNPNFRLGSVQADGSGYELTRGWVASQVEVGNARASILSAGSCLLQQQLYLVPFTTYRVEIMVEYWPVGGVLTTNLNPLTITEAGLYSFLFFNSSQKLGVLLTLVAKQALGGILTRVSVVQV